MRIGGAWTRTSEKSGKTFISGIFDKEFLELCLQLKNFSLLLSYISPDDRKNEKSPSWSINLIKNNNDCVKKQESSNPEQTVLQDTTAQTSYIPSVEEAPY